MEPSKNIVRGMLAFEELLTAHPEWRGRVVHVACAYPSRQGLAEYLAYGADVEHTAERINHAFGAAADGWTPIVLPVEDDWARSLAALTLSDVLLVNPVRDGLNLVAKEGPLVNTVDGVLVLSRQAGAWAELGALDGQRARRQPLRRGHHGRGPPRGAVHGARAAGAQGAACGPPCEPARRPTGGRTSWRPPAGSDGRPQGPDAAAAPASTSNSATAPAAPCTVTSARAATSAGLSASTAATFTTSCSGPAGGAQLVEGGERRQVADVVTEGRRVRQDEAPSRPSCSATKARTTVPLSTWSGGRSSRSARPGCTTRPASRAGARRTR